MENREERIQRALNDQKRKHLEEQRGVRFFQGDRRMPPDAEGDWLGYIAEFERQYSAHKRISVRAFIGHSGVQPLASIPPQELDATLEGLLELLLDNNIVIHFGRPVSDAEAYRFITEELLEEEMDDIRIDGMIHTFAYNDFHPDEASTIRTVVEDVLLAFFTRDRGALWRMASHADGSAPDHRRAVSSELMSSCEQVYSRIAAFTGHGVGMVTSAIDGRDAEARCLVSWAGIERQTRLVHGGSGEAVIRLHQNRYHTWDIVRLALPGLMPEEE